MLLRGGIVDLLEMSGCLGGGYEECKRAGQDGKSLHRPRLNRLEFQIESKLFSRITVPIIMLVDFVINYRSLIRATMATPKRVSGLKWEMLSVGVAGSFSGSVYVVKDLTDQHIY